MKKFSCPSAAPKELKVLYKELLQREKYLKKEPTSIKIDGKIQENALCIVRVQQLMMPYLGIKK